MPRPTPDIGVIGEVGWVRLDLGCAHKRTCSLDVLSNHVGRWKRSQLFPNGQTENWVRSHIIVHMWGWQHIFSDYVSSRARESSSNTQLNNHSTGRMSMWDCWFQKKPPPHIDIEHSISFSHVHRRFTTIIISSFILYIIFFPLCNLYMASTNSNGHVTNSHWWTVGRWFVDFIQYFTSLKQFHM